MYICIYLYCFGKFLFQSERRCSEVFCKISFLKNFTKFTRKHLYRSLFFNKISAWMPASSKGCF